MSTTLNELYRIPVNNVKVGKAMTSMGFEKKNSRRGTLYAVDQVAYPSTATGFMPRSLWDPFNGCGHDMAFADVRRGALQMFRLSVANYREALS